MDGLTAAPPNPALCACFRLQESFQALLNDPASGTARADALVAIKGLSFLPSYLSSTKSEKSNPEIMNSVLEFCRTRAFFPENLYVYLAPPDDYVFFVTGNVLPERWRELFPPRSVVTRSDGFAVTDPAPGLRNPPLLHFAPGWLLLCPTNLEGTILDSIRGEQSTLGESWETFRRMAARKPLLAVEVNIEDLLSRLGPNWKSESLLPTPLRDISTMRWIVDAGIFKAQLFTLRDDPRKKILKASQELVEQWKKSLPASADQFGSRLRPLVENLRTDVQGKSVFLEGPGLGKNTLDAGNRMLGIISRLAAGGVINSK